VDIRIKSKTTLTRRLAILLGGLAMLYPLIRLVTHRVPRKPKVLEISGTIKENGHIIRDDFIVFSRQDKIWAVTRRCTHLGCRLNYMEDRELLECPCHQSRFTIEGALLNGPAQKKLSRYAVEQKESPTRLLVTIQ